MYESLIEDFELVVGDSSDVFMFLSPDVTTFSDEWEAWMAIVEEMEDVSPIVIRQLPRNLAKVDVTGVVLEEANKYFVAQITPEESSRLLSGIKYNFVIQIKNDTLGYKQELVQCKLKTRKQGIFR